MPKFHDPDEYVMIHRPEIHEYFTLFAGNWVEEKEFVAGYKALGLPRTSPSKGHALYQTLLKIGFIKK